MTKSLSSNEDLIKYMKSQGIKFQVFNEEDTKNFLEECTYYKKVSSYKKNFLTIKVGEEKLYADLDFAYLKEISSIDADLRSIILTISLNIEHAVKVTIINKCLEHGFNGFDIVEKFFEKYPQVKDNILKYMHNSYCEDIIYKHRNRMPIWVVVETISFGDLCLLYKFMVDNNYFGDKKKAEIRDSVGILYSVHNIRNAAAHNHCLLRDLRYSDAVSDVVHMISRYVSDVPDISNDQRKKALKTKFYYDFTCLLYSIDYFMKSQKMKDKAKNSLNVFMKETAVRHKEYFTKCIPIKNAYTFFRKILDKYS